MGRQGRPESTDVAAGKSEKGDVHRPVEEAGVREGWSRLNDEEIVQERLVEESEIKRQRRKKGEKGEGCLPELPPGFSNVLNEL